MRLPRRFQWLAADDSTSTHLELKTGGMYPTGNVTTDLLVAWAKEDKLRFVDDLDGEDLPPDTVLEVQNIRIDLKAVIAERPKTQEVSNG